MTPLLLFRGDPIAMTNTWFIIIISIHGRTDGGKFNGRLDGETLRTFLSLFPTPVVVVGC